MGRGILIHIDKMALSIESLSQWQFILELLKIEYVCEKR